ncbi:ribose 5-phosphate isomerase B [Fulvivirgaceae bacterium BMA12]|uniref:Ribose 5-phosphate isomerase B n=1 Tax=Agaribacillus aureus TaxID=3051825 RepID=A0ABT8LFF6_9BACT|nr:ribose 5-phosphate isomerase B [Fulvivirgaceae bacterium BMA12]
MTAKIAIGGDHAGYEYKERLVEQLKKKGIEVKDFGPFSPDSVDYPDFVHPVARHIEEGHAEFGILICGSGNGVAITANKHQEIRAALCWQEELAALARQHNNANVLCLPARFIDYPLAEKIVEVFLASTFEGGRHARRVSKISC